MVCQERRIAFGSPSFFVTMYYIKQVFKINRIYGSCFCENLKTITILSNCNIGDYAFSNCRKLEKINISPDIVNVGYGAFYGCENLSNDTLKDLYERFGPKAFEKEKIRKRRRTNSIENSIELQVALTNAIWKCY